MSDPIYAGRYASAVIGRMGPTHKPLCKCPGLYPLGAEYAVKPCEKDATQEDGWCDHCREVCTEVLALDITGLEDPRHHINADSYECPFERECYEEWLYTKRAGHGPEPEEA